MTNLIQFIQEQHRWGIAIFNNARLTDSYLDFQADEPEDKHADKIFN